MRKKESGKLSTSAHSVSYRSQSDNLDTFEELTTHLSSQEKLAILGVNTMGLSDENFLPALSEAQVVVEKRIFGLGHKLRPCMINLVNCTQVFLEAIRACKYFYKSLPSSPYPQGSVASSAGAVITIDCDYAAVNDSMRTRPPMVTNVEISDIKVGNVKTTQGKYSCYRPVLILGPLKESYNGNPTKDYVQPVTNITISNCDFGTSVVKDEPFFLHNVMALSLNNVMINNQTFTAIFNSKDQRGKSGT